MIAENNIVLEQAVANVSQLTEDKRIQDEIWKREDNARIERTNKNAYERAVVQLREKDALIE